jgi:hypothetical protein
MSNDNKFLQGKIYKVVDKTNGNVYIGSTICTLNTRLCKHINDYRMSQRGIDRNNRKVFEIIKNNDFFIELLKEYPCESNLELCREEGYLQMTNKCINKMIAGTKKYQLKRLKNENNLKE